jgi:hypothetical protein
MMKIENFSKRCRELFIFLENEYQCTVSEEQTPFRSAVTYINETTSVRISFEPREGGLFVLLSRLRNGEIPPYPIFIKPQTQINSFYLDDILSLRAPEKIGEYKKQLEEGKTAMAEQLHFYASMLRRYTKDILQGDFSIYADMEQIVKKRAGIVKM